MPPDLRALQQKETYDEGQWRWQLHLNADERAKHKIKSPTASETYLDPTFVPHDDSKDVSIIEGPVVDLRPTDPGITQLMAEPETQTESSVANVDTRWDPNAPEITREKYKDIVESLLNSSSTFRDIKVVRDEIIKNNGNLVFYFDIKYDYSGPEGVSHTQMQGDVILTVLDPDGVCIYYEKDHPDQYIGQSTILNYAKEYQIANLMAQNPPLAVDLKSADKSVENKARIFLETNSQDMVNKISSELIASHIYTTAIPTNIYMSQNLGDHTITEYRVTMDHNRQHPVVVDLVDTSGRTPNPP